ncbi:aspartate aminotransferase family protein [Jiangella gansuensis]|uniref:aspartate aminotransferase family protein n=1 Tax=Jiangella gansuensis TaxID=281473 RepID=UPI0004796D00|nr:aspartate aminotransferase family protein [Jiangella gansuensis]
MTTLEDALSQRTAAEARRVIPGGVNSAQRALTGMDDVVITRSAGSRLWTSDGVELIDFHGAYGPPILGHNDPEVDSAVAAALRRIDNPGVGVTPYEIELAERIVDAFPSVEQVLFTNSGSEATFHALRVARTVTGRRKVIKFQGCYHGWHDSVAMNVISPADRVGGRDPLSAGILSEVLEATIVVPFNDAAAVETALRDNDGQVAAIIVEPIPHNVGALLPADGFLAELRRLATSHGVVLVFDEVICGFRHSLAGYQGIAGVVPDLTTMGKAFANGYPIAALGGRAELMQQFSTTPGRPAFFAGTYNGHPAMAAAAIATVDKLRSEPVYEHLFRLGDLARDRLRSLYKGLGIDVVVSGYGSVFVTYFMEGPVNDYRDLLRNDADLFTQYRIEQLADGVLEVPLNLKRSNLSYAHTEDDIDRLLTATERAVTTVLARR